MKITNNEVAKLIFDAGYGSMPEIRDWINHKQQASLRDQFAMASMTQIDVIFAGLFSGRWAAWIAFRRADALLKMSNKAKEQAQ